MMRFLRFIALGVVIPMVAACGTVVNGFHQDLAITSLPGGSQVSVDGVPSGTTPMVVPVRRSRSHVVKVEREGYHPIETSVVPVISPWEWGNLIFGGLIGLAIDAWTGGMYDMSHDRVYANFPSLPDKTAATK